jgi:hypothetical protein
MPVVRLNVSVWTGFKPEESVEQSDAHQLQFAKDDGFRGGLNPSYPVHAHRARVSASQMPPPIMKPPEARDNSRVRRAEKKCRARPASSA